MCDLAVAIIIPVKRFNGRLKKSIEKCLQLDYGNFEIIVLPDEPFSEFKSKIKVVPTGNIGPALKRDIALNHSKAQVLAFLDDDAYPETYWLKNAVRHFQNQEIAAVGGPAVTPEESCLFEKASGYVFSSFLASGKYVYRYIPQNMQEVDDYPSCNFIVRRDMFEKVGGFNNKFWPGEDTKLCLDITKKLGRKIVYDPLVLVQHHRRCLFLPHMKQVANYALHRGYFAKRFPETSLRIVYFMPSFLVLYILIGTGGALVNKNSAFFYSFSMIVYVLTILSTTCFTLFNKKVIETFWVKLKLVFFVSIGIIITHISYGIFFMVGIFSNKLREE